MSEKMIYPAIDIKDGKVVRLLQGDYNQQIDYAENPQVVAESFRQQGAKWIHIVDLDGAKSGLAYNFETIKQILQIEGLNIQVGGGIRNKSTIEKLIKAGAKRVIIGTRAIEDWQWFESLVHNPEFAGKIVLGLDAREGKLATSGWTEQTEISARDIAKKVSSWPIAAIVYTDIARDGMLIGPNYAQLEAIAEATAIPIIASGGISSLDDVKKLLALPIAGMIIGRAIYEGKVDLRRAIELAKNYDN